MVSGGKPSGRVPPRLSRQDLHSSEPDRSGERGIPSRATRKSTTRLRVVEAAREAKSKSVGAFLVDGRMIDAPFIRRAEAIVALARAARPRAGDGPEAETCP